MDSAENAAAYIQVRHQAVWELAATSLVLRGESAVDPTLYEAATEVAVTAGLCVVVDGTVRLAPGVEALVEQRGSERTMVAAQTAAPVLQAAAVLGGTRVWEDQDDEALLAQGRASAQAAAQFKRFAIPAMDGLDELLAAPGCTMLDVGVGVAAMAIAYCQVFPTLRVVGIDLLPRALELAQEAVIAAGLEDRVELRHVDVAALDVVDAFCLAWLPAPFLPAPALMAGIHRVAVALVPGGWVVVGHGKFDEDPAANAITRFQTAAFGGTALDDGEAQRLLVDAGFERVSTLPTPPGSPGVTVGRRPAL